MPAPALISFKLTAEQAQALLDALRQIAGEDHFKHRAEVRAFYAAQTRALLVSVSKRTYYLGEHNMNVWL